MPSVGFLGVRGVRPPGLFWFAMVSSSLCKNALSRWQRLLFNHLPPVVEIHSVLEMYRFKSL